MRIRIIILLAFLSLVCFGQYQAPNMLWNGTINVVGSDTLLYDSVSASNTTWKLIKYTGSLLVDYISTKEDGFLVIGLDTIPVNCLGGIGLRNLNDADTLFTQLAEHTIASDSTEIYPQRITRIGYYSTPTTDANNYWNALTITASMWIVAPSGGDFTTIQAANNSGSVVNSDTIVVKKGIYSEGNYLTISKQLTLVALDAVKLINNATQTQLIFTNADNIKIEGFHLKGNSSTYNIYVTNQNSNTIKNCYLTGHTRNAFLLDGVNGGNSWNYIYNCFIDNASNNYTHVRSQYSNYIISGNRFYRGVSYCVQDFTTADNTYISKIYYNKSMTDNTGTSFYLMNNSGINVKFNKTETLFQDRYVLYSGTGAVSKTINVSYNDFDSDSTNNSYGFLVLGDTTNLWKFDVIGNNININTFSRDVVAIDIESPYDINISDNTIDLSCGLIGIAANSVNQDSAKITISGNKIYIRKTNSNAQGYNIFVNYAEGFLPNHDLEIYNNDLKLPRAWDKNAVGGHANIYFFNVKKSLVHHNSIKGGEICGMHYKGANGTTSGIECENTYFYYNLVDSTNILLKGVRNVNILNNTVVNSFSDDAIRVFTNEDAPPNEDCAYNTIRNNIFYQYDTNGMYPLFVGAPADTFGMVLSNNIYYGNDSVIFAGTSYTTPNFLSAGFSPNSYYSNPNFVSSTQPWPKQPSNAIGKGYVLGTAYQYGLNTSSTWPDGIILRRQNSKYWTMGAYVVDLNLTLTNSGVTFVIGGKDLILK